MITTGIVAQVPRAFINKLNACQKGTTSPANQTKLNKTTSIDLLTHLCDGFHGLWGLRVEELQGRNRRKYFGRAYEHELGNLWGEWIIQ